MSAIRIADNVHWVGVKDPALRVFDIIMETQHGTTYNAYLIRGSEKTALIDTVKSGFTDQYLANIEEITPLDKIDLLIVNHTEPDHSGAMNVLLDKLPYLEIICAAPALPFVRNVLNREANVTPVKDNHTVDLGGKTLVFKGTPYMHWPDTMMEFLNEDNILFSCDGFAAHISFDSIWSDECRQDFDREMWDYYDAIMRPFGTYISRNMKKLDDLDIRMIATSHGPLVRKDARGYLNKYKEWSADKSAEKSQITILYVSSYGNTKKMADSLSEKLKSKGYTIEMIDTAQLDEKTARDTIESSKALLFGTPTFAGDAVRPIWDAVNLLSTVPAAGKKAAVFGSYGWGGEGPQLVADRLSGLRLKVYDDILKARLVPSDEELASLDEYCTKLAEFVG